MTPTALAKALAASPEDLASCSEGKNRSFRHAPDRLGSTASWAPILERAIRCSRDQDTLGRLGHPSGESPEHLMTM